MKIKRTHWSKAEDIKLNKLYKRYGNKWNIISLKINKTSKQCRERYLNFNECINKDQLTVEERRQIDKLQYQYGNKWTLIAKYIPGRSANHIKNYWHSQNTASKISENINIQTNRYDLDILAFVATIELYIMNLTQ